MESRTVPYESAPRFSGPAPELEPREVSLLDVLLMVTRHRRLVIGVTVAFALLGVVFALLQPDRYTASATLVREAEDGFSSGSAISALRSFGLNLGATEPGLSVEAYPDLLTTREVRLTLLRDTFLVPSEGESVQLLDYLLRPTPIGTVTSAPRRALKWLRGSAPPALPSSEPGTVLTELEQVAIGQLGDITSVSTDEETGLMQLAATTRDPYLSAAVVERSINLLSVRVREIRTQKARDNLAFVTERFSQAESDLQRAQGRLATFDDRNRAIQTASLRAQRERLQQDLSFKRDYYNELRTEVTRAELDLQRSEPIITVIEQPIPMLRASGPKRMLIVISMLLAGLVVGIGGSLLAELAARGSQEDREKWSEMKRSLSLPWSRSRQESRG